MIIILVGYFYYIIRIITNYKNSKDITNIFQYTLQRKNTFNMYYE